MYKAHTEEQFKEFMSQLVETNATLGFFSDFNKIAANVDAISIKLHQLNYLIGQEDMAAAIKSLWEENPKVFSVLDILIAIRTSEKKKAIDKNGCICLIEDFFETPEVYSTEFEEMKCLGEDLKRFDFVITTSVKTYLIEVNFYSGGGSKLNEVARSYSELAPKINRFPNYEFIWITDGVGWKSARNKLEEAYYAIPGIYNLTTITDFIGKVKVQK